MKQQEHIEQVAIIQWATYMQSKYPALKFLFAIPNGGARSIRTAIKLKKEGVKRGVPDLFLPVANSKYHGLFIELKVGKNKPSVFQREYLEFLNGQNYLAVVCYSYEEAVAYLQEYLDIK